MTADELRANDYDSFASAYTAATEANLVNGYYERPAILALAGAVAGRRVLDAGCGSGPLYAALRDRGAIATGIDSSAEMLTLARQRLGTDAALHLADLGDPLPFPDGSFDDVIASLVLHYLKDWTAPLAEIRRVLTPGGRLIASIEHPFQSQMQAGPGADYFSTRKWSFEWSLSGHTARMSFWHRPLHAMTDAFTSAGFQIAVISEPQPSPEGVANDSRKGSPRSRQPPASCSSSSRPRTGSTPPKTPGPGARHRRRPPLAPTTLRSDRHWHPPAPSGAILDGHLI